LRASRTSSGGAPLTGPPLTGPPVLGFLLLGIFLFGIVSLTSKFRYKSVFRKEKCYTNISSDIVLGSVLDPDPDPCGCVLKWLPWIWIPIGNTDPDPGQSKWCPKRGEGNL